MWVWVCFLVRLLCRPPFELFRFICVCLFLGVRFTVGLWEGLSLLLFSVCGWQCHSVSSLAVGLSACDRCNATILLREDISLHLCGLTHCMQTGIPLSTTPVVCQGTCSVPMRSGQDGLAKVCALRVLVLWGVEPRALPSS